MRPVLAFKRFFIPVFIGNYSVLLEKSGHLFFELPK